MKRNIIAILTLFIQPLLYGQADPKIFNAFKQGNVNEGGNCVSIALIKAAFSKYGYDSLFLSVKETGNSFQVTMRDDVTVNFTKEELKKVEERANFKLKDSTEFSL